MLFALSALTAIAIMPLEFKAAALLLILVRYLVVVLRARSIAKRVGEQGVALRYFIFDIFNPLMLLYTRTIMLQKDTTAWK